jgi:hypothetical protein
MPRSDSRAFLPLREKRGRRRKEGCAADFARTGIAAYDRDNRLFSGGSEWRTRSRTVERHGLTFTSFTPPLAALVSLSCFTLRLKPRKTGEALRSSMCEVRRS